MIFRFWLMKNKTQQLDVLMIESCQVFFSFFLSFRFHSAWYLITVECSMAGAIRCDYVIRKSIEEALKLFSSISVGRPWSEYILNR